MRDRTKYTDPLVSRYTSPEMQHIFSEQFKFRQWKKCWIALAEAQHELGLKVVTKAKIRSLKKHADDIDFAAAEEMEARIRHDVMSHVHAFGQQAPDARGIIHLGATSQFVGCNTELVQMRQAMELIRTRLVNVISNMARIADAHKDWVTLGFTHYQPAQPTTVGKRMTLYIQDLLADLDAVEGLEFKARSVRGTTGTHASFKDLFGGSYATVKKLEKLVAAKLGFTKVFDVTGQTYPRKFDTKVAESLAGIGVSLYRFAGDLRLLSNQKVVDEPFAVRQTGSSAMPYKRNPMRSERLCGLARKLCGLVPDFYATAQNQWMERTLDDSAIRRMDIPQMFLLAEAVLILAQNITGQDVDPKKGRPLTFYRERINRLLNDELPFMATEAILMDAVKAGADRQEMHEVIKKHAVAAGLAIKEQGAANDLFERLAADPAFPMDMKKLKGYLARPERFTGFAARQTADFIKNRVAPRLKPYKKVLGKAAARLTV